MADVIVSTNEDRLLAEAKPGKGIEFDGSRPTLIFKGIDENIATDGFIMLIGHGAKDIIKDWVTSRTGITAIKRDMKYKTREEAEKYIKEQLNSPTGKFPDVDQLIPKKKQWAGELTPVALKPASDETERNILILSDGDRIIGVDIDKYAFLREKLPNAKVHARREQRLYFPDATEGSLGASDWESMDHLDPTSPIVFVDDNKPAGILMPVWLNFAMIPDKEIKEVMEKAATLPVTTGPLEHRKEKARHNGSFDISDQHGATEFVLHIAKVQDHGYKKIYEGSKEDYKGQGDIYFTVTSKDNEFPPRVIAFEDTMEEKKLHKYDSHNVLRKDRIEPAKEKYQDSYTMAEEAYNRLSVPRYKDGSINDYELKKKINEEAWMMTRDELRQQLLPIYKLLVAESNMKKPEMWVKRGNKFVNNGAYDSWRSHSEVLSNVLHDLENPSETRKYNIDEFAGRGGVNNPMMTHADAVAAAVAAGKPVPDRVLKEYPTIQRPGQNYSEQELEKAHETRSVRSQLLDEAKEHDKTIKQGDPKVRKWVNHPGRYDVEGVDTPRKKKKPVKSKKQTKTRAKSNMGVSSSR